MKAAFLIGFRQIEMKDIDKSVLQKGEVLVKLKYVGVCGSDVHYYRMGRIGSQVVKYPYYFKFFSHYLTLFL